MDGAEEFTELADEVFGEVLQQCKREKTHTISPQKNTKPQMSLAQGLADRGRRNELAKEP